MANRCFDCRPLASLKRFQAECQVKQKRPWRPCTTQRHPCHPIVSNVLNRNFTAQQPHQLWMGDITYIPTGGFLYLATVKDLFSRTIVGMALANHLQTSLVKTAFEMAWHQENPQQVAIFYSDQGTQYTSREYQHLLEGKVTQVSMSHNGNCWDNAPMESFFVTLKTECVVEPFHSHRQAKSEIFHYIFGFYNNSRLHSSLGYMSPTEFEHHCRRQLFCPN